jgi:hypothetical protein
MRLYATYNQATKHVVATVARLDGNETHVWFDSPAAFRTWLEALEAKVEREHTAAAGDRLLLQMGSPINGHAPGTQSLKAG